MELDKMTINKLNVVSLSGNDDRWESLQRSFRPLTYGEGLTASRQEPHTALGPSGFVSMGLRAQPITELATVLMTDFKYRPTRSSYFSGFGERRKCTQL